MCTVTFRVDAQAVAVVMNISKIPQLNFPWKLTGNFPEIFRPFATLFEWIYSLDFLSFLENLF